MKKRKLVVIGANDFQNQLILKAKNKGYETHVFAWECGDVGEKSADYFYPISIIEKEHILEECKRIHPDGIVSIASDLANITVNYVAQHLGLTCNGIHCTELSTNKHRMRETFDAYQLPSPKSVQVCSAQQAQALQVQFPVIVKPVDRSGSRGIFKVEDAADMEQAVNAALAESFEKKVLVEEFAQGDEFSVEYISYHGTHHFLALTRKYTTGAPNFIETAHIEPAPVSGEILAMIQSVVPQALDALEIKNGASHSEVKIDRNGVLKIIEIGSRMGGDCIGSDLVYLSTGYDCVEMVIDIACGEPLRMERKRKPAYAMVRFVFDRHDLENLEWVKQHHPDVLYRVSQLEEPDSREIHDSSARYGYYLCVAEDSQEIYEILGKVNG